MKEINIPIKENQRLRDVLPNNEIPTNTILYKTLTGLGATYSEIKAQRNSIIIEPNKPVILGKTRQEIHQNDNLLGVCEGVTKDDIVEYINQSDHHKKYIKILTTPESFRKVQDAFEEVGMNIQNECFLLFDECHKLVKDVDYRSDITLPMDFFFNCIDKAIVSATPISCKDPRFNNFQLMEILPTFDYRKEIQFRPTNNILLCARETIKEVKDIDVPIFFFVNSTDMIYSLMKQTDTINDSAVFCSEKSVEKLKDYGFFNVSDDWERDKTKMKKYNWMTSRFFNAFDIELADKPIVVIITDCYLVEWSMVDPYADVVQILGRFRNGITSAFHLSNFYKVFPIKSKDEIILSYECSKKVYETLVTLRESATTNEMREAFYNAIQTLPYTQFLDERKRVNYFAVDNYIDEELIKSHYNNYKELTTAYKNLVQYFILNSQYKHYPIEDKQRLVIESKTASMKEKRKTLVEILDVISELDGSIANEYRRELEQIGDKLIIEAYEELGKDKIEELDYSVRRVKEALILKRHSERSKGTEALELIYNKFSSGVRYNASYIKKTLVDIFKKLNVPHLKAITSHTILDYFYAVEKNTKESRGYLLLKPKFVVR